MWACRPTRPQVRRSERCLDRAGREAVGESEAELRVELTGLDVVMGPCLDPRRHPDQDLLLPPGGGTEPVEALDLGDRIADHMADAVLDHLAQFGRRLVVAVHVDQRRVEPRPQRGRQLAVRRDVDRKPLGLEDTLDRGDRRRLARVDDLELLRPRPEGVEIRAGAGPDVVGDVDVGRGPELARELNDVAATHLEATAIVDPTADRVDRRALDGVRLGCLPARGHPGDGL